MTPLAVPLGRALLALTPPRRGRRGPYARVWQEIAERWGAETLCGTAADPGW